jgi:hypothetical protein
MYGALIDLALAHTEALGAAGNSRLSGAQSPAAQNATQKASNLIRARKEAFARKHLGFLRARSRRRLKVNQIELERIIKRQD